MGFFGKEQRQKQKQKQKPLLTSLPTPSLPIRAPLDYQQQQAHFTNTSSRYVANNNAPQSGLRWATNLPETTFPPQQLIPSGISRQEAMRSHTDLRFLAEADERTLCSLVDDRLSEVITLVDVDGYIENERDLVINLPPLPSSAQTVLPTVSNMEPLSRSLVHLPLDKSKHVTKIRKDAQLSQIRSINILSKVSFYRNSSLPTSLPPLRIYISTYPLLCLAAQYSSESYFKSILNTSDPTSTPAIYIPASATDNTKAMILKTSCSDTTRTITFAIRGTSRYSLRDWSTNLANTPTPPSNFLDDEGNLCHAGFLSVAHAMIVPLALKLRELLEENPSRSECSLLITGHSAGGAVASLIYAHMLSQNSNVQSQLKNIAGCFKRLHCVTFGSPPVSLLPLSKPTTGENEKRLRKCLFFGFINEGDLVARAEPAYMKSLVNLLVTPLPSKSVVKMTGSERPKSSTGIQGASLLDLSTSLLPENCSTSNIIKKFVTPPLSALQQPNTTLHPSKPPSSQSNRTWRLPPAIFSNAGRLILLRVSPLPVSTVNKKNSSSKTALLRRHEFETVAASTITDDQIRQVVFGDPLMHAMEVYRRRIEALSFRAVTGRGSGG